MDITMKRLRRAALAAVALTAGAGGTALMAAAPAGASSTQVSVVGSYTTFSLMQTLFPKSVNNINPNTLPYPDGLSSMSIASDPLTCSGGVTYTGSQAPNGSGAGKQALVTQESAAANEQGCIDFSRSSSPPTPAQTAFNTANLTLPSTFTEKGDPFNQHIDYYAYALDGVSALLGSNSGGTAASPVTMTLTQLQDIYACWNFQTNTPVTTWAQAGIGTSTDTIVRYWPQSGSGTRAVMTDVLGFDPTDLTVAHFNHCSSPVVQQFSYAPTGKSDVNEENYEDGIMYNASVNGPTADTDAIYVYSAGKFVSQWNDPTDYNTTASNRVAAALNTGNPDIGNFDPSLTLAAFQSCTNVYELPGGITGGALPTCDGVGHTYVSFTPHRPGQGTMAINSATVAESNENYHLLPSNANLNPSLFGGPTGSFIPGIRYVYNVADTLSPEYNAAKMMIGFDNEAQGTESALCHGDDSAIIAGQGFVPLSNNAGNTAPAGSDVAGATCREFPGGFYPGQAPSNYSWQPTANSQDNN